MPAGGSYLLALGAELFIGLGQHEIERRRQIVVMPGLPFAVIVLEIMALRHHHHHGRSRGQEKGKFEQTPPMDLQEYLQRSQQPIRFVPNILHCRDLSLSLIISYKNRQ